MTNEDRKLIAIRKDVKQSPLMKLGTWVYGHENNIRNAPHELLIETQLHIAKRLESLCGSEKQSGRVRVQIKWLSRWAEIVKKELATNRGDDISDSK